MRDTVSTHPNKQKTVTGITISIVCLGCCTLSCQSVISIDRVGAVSCAGSSRDCRCTCYSRTICWVGSTLTQIEKSKEKEEKIERVFHLIIG